MIRVRWIAISFVMRQRCFPHIGVFSFLHRECINLHEGRLRNKMHLHSTLNGCFFCVKRFWPITRVENNSQEKFTILHVPYIGFLCYSNWHQILLYGRWLEVRMNICTALWSFVNFFCLSQSEVSTGNWKVSTFFAFQHVRCRCCYRSYLDRFLKEKRIEYLYLYLFLPHPIDNTLVVQYQLVKGWLYYVYIIIKKKES